MGKKKKKSKRNAKRQGLDFFLATTNLMKKKYTISLYTGGVNVKKWDILTKAEKSNALKKSWCIVWYFRNPETNLLERQSNRKFGVNRLRTMSLRYDFLKSCKRAMKERFSNGYSPYTKKDNQDNFELNESKEIHSIKEALDLAYDHSKLTVAKVTASSYRTTKNQFIEFIGAKNSIKDIQELNKSAVLKFLNHKLKETSARTRNNSKASLSALFSIMENQLDIIDRNFIKDISNEKTKAKTDRTFTKKELKEIVDWLRENDAYLLLYVRFVAYSFLRPVEVNRLKVKDINLEESLLYFQAKNKPLKVKRIPSIFIEDIKAMNLHLYNKEHFLFTPKNEPSEWVSDDNSKRDAFSKRFKTVKDKFNLGAKYGLYSFRHSFITNLFRTLRTTENKSYSEAIEFLQPITGHETREALEKYIHTHDMDIPKDWSDKIDFIL